MSDTIILRLRYIHNTCTAFVFLKHKIYDKLDIDRDIKQPKSYLPENATEAVQPSNFQIMPFVYSFVKVLNLRTKFGMPPDTLLMLWF